MRKNVMVLGILLIGYLTSLKANQPFEFSKTPAFKSGEVLIYRLHYGIINGGLASLTVKQHHTDSATMYHARMIAKTVGLADKLFSIKDCYESYFDPELTLPYKAIRNISEGNYRFYNEATFKFNDTIVNSQKSGRHVVPKGTLDMVSSLYYLRNLDIEQLKYGDELDLNTFFGDELFPFKLRYKGIEKIKTNYGKLRCYRFDPVVEPGRMFKSEDSMSFWLSADKSKLPVLVSFDMPIGSVKCELINYGQTLTTLSGD